MTLAAAQNWVAYDGDGVNGTFGYSFEIDTNDGSDLEVYIIDNTGTVTFLTSNYTINVPGAQILYPTVGGASPLGPGVNKLPVGWELVIVRIEPISQDLDLNDQGVFSADAMEASLDKITMILQQLQEQINRAYKAPVGTVLAATTLSSFITSISGVFPPMSVDTYSNLKLLSAGDPTLKRWGFATDLNNGLGQLCFYSAVVSSGDVGWFLIPIEFFQG